MLHQQLKQTTELEHAILEKKTIGMLLQSRTVEHYTRFLKRMYEYYSPSEIQVEKYYNQLITGDTGRRKSKNDYKDLSLFTKDIDKILMNESGPFIGYCSGALGALYVLEGSTLRG